MDEQGDAQKRRFDIDALREEGWLEAERVLARHTGRKPSPWSVFLVMIVVAVGGGAAPSGTQGDERATQQPKPGDMRRFDGIEFVWVPPGAFKMGSSVSAREVVRQSGSTDAKAEWFEGEHPQHTVRLTHGFWLGRYEVTQSQWRTVMGSAPSDFTGDTLPVEMVSWEDCQSFLEKLNGGSSGRYRLPSEAEWEYACRAGTTGPFGIGNGGSLSSSEANFDGNHPYGGAGRGTYREKTSTVGSFSPNSWGLYDMHGNVWEWCQDWKGDYASETVTDPRGPLSGSQRVLRGGSWFSLGYHCRSAKRLCLAPDSRYSSNGFRVLRTP